MSGHHGMPGPGGSMGECAVCGESFIKEVLFDLIGVGQEGGNIISFQLSFTKDTLYAHAPDCANLLKSIFKDMRRPSEFRQDMLLLHDKLPDGPLKKALKKSINEGESKRPWE